jgi:Mn2+/Fe2+ NRAMP family transporter
MNFTAINPISALYWSAVLNSVAALPVMVAMMILATRPKVMGRFAVRGWLKWLGWAATGAMGAAVLAMAVTSIPTDH